MTENPAQGRPTPPRDGNVPLAREAQRPTTPNHACPGVNTSASQPSVPVERSNDNGTGTSSYTNGEVPRTAPLEKEPLRNDEGHTCLVTSSHYIVSGSVGTSPSAMGSLVGLGHLCRRFKIADSASQERVLRGEILG